MSIIRPVKPGDAERLATILRPDDAAEVMAASGLTPEVALPQAVELSTECYTFFGDTEEDVGGMFGVAQQTAKVGRVWMLGTDNLERGKYVFTFLREGREWFDKLNERWPCLWNYVWAQNGLHIKWLKWVGCTFHRYSVRLGPLNEAFHSFMRVKK